MGLQRVGVGGKLGEIVERGSNTALLLHGRGLTIDIARDGTDIAGIVHQAGIDVERDDGLIDGVGVAGVGSRHIALLIEVVGGVGVLNLQFKSRTGHGEGSGARRLRHTVANEIERGGIIACREVFPPLGIGMIRGAEHPAALHGAIDGACGIAHFSLPLHARIAVGEGKVSADEVAVGSEAMRGLHLRQRKP